MKTLYCKIIDWLKVEKHGFSKDQLLKNKSNHWMFRWFCRNSSQAYAGGEQQLWPTAERVQNQDWRGSRRASQDPSAQGPGGGFCHNVPHAGNRRVVDWRHCDWTCGVLGWVMHGLVEYGDGLQIGCTKNKLVLYFCGLSLVLSRSLLPLQGMHSCNLAAISYWFHFVFTVLLMISSMHDCLWWENTNGTYLSLAHLYVS